MPTTCCWTIQSIMVCACFLVNLKLTLTHSLAVRNKEGKGKHETSGSCFTSPTYDLTFRKQRVSVVFRNPVRLVCPWFLKPRRAPNRQQISGSSRLCFPKQHLCHGDTLFIFTETDCGLCSRTEAAAAVLPDRSRELLRNRHATNECTPGNTQIWFGLHCFRAREQTLLEICVCSLHGNLGRI